MRKSSFLLLSLAVVILDQWSKWQVETHLAGRGPKTLIPGFLDLIYVKNSGVAFGMFASHGDATGTLLLTTLGLAALGLVGYYFWKTPADHRLLLTALGLVLGGAVGNLIDRIMVGEVTDFIDAYFGSYHWHTFNIADSAISIGIGLMALEIFFGKQGEPAAP